MTISGQNETGVDFSGSAITYDISGQVTANGTGLDGVTITLSGAGSGTTTTDIDGDYSFSGLSNGSYTVTPSLTGYTFDPTSRNVTISGQNETGVDFSADEEISISENSVVLEEETTESLVSVSSDNSTLTFDFSTSTLETLQQDDVVAIAVTDESPYGLLRKVTSITQEGDQVIVETTQAKLTDVIEQGTISASKTLTTSHRSIASVETLKGVSLRTQPTVRNARAAAAAVEIDPDTELFNLDLNGVVLYDHDGNENTTNDQIVADGGISFGLGFDLDIQIKWWKVESLSFTTTPWQIAEISISSSISKSIEKKVQIAKYYMSPITVMVGTWPVVMVPVITVYVGLDGEVSIGITTGITESASLTAGVEYKDDEWGPVSDFDIDFDYQLPELYASASVKGYVEPDFALLIYGIVGPYATLQGYLQLDADINDEPWWSLYAGIAVGAGVEVEVIGYEIVDFEIPNIIEYQILLAQANISPTATITSPSDGSTYPEGDTITFSGSAEDPEDGALTGDSLVWTSSIDGQIGTGTSFTRDDLLVGEHTVTLTATDSNGAPGDLSISITIGQPEPDIVFHSYAIDDQFGNSDGVPNPGEEIVLAIKLCNNGNVEANNVEGTLYSLDQYITIDDSSFNLGSISASSCKTDTTALLITVSPSSPNNHVADFTLGLLSDEKAYDSAAFSITITQ